MNPQVCAAIMAGGRSSRFGQDKALLEVGGRTLLQRAAALLLSVTDDVLVVGPDERRGQVDGVAVVRDLYPGIGPLGGISSALAARPEAAVIVVAVDMPFLSPALLAFLISLRSEGDIVLPVVDGRGQQLLAVYGQNCRRPIAQQIAAGDYKIDRFFPQMQVRRVEEIELRRFDPALRSFTNVNTREAWTAIFDELAER